MTGKPPAIVATFTGLLLAGYLGVVCWAWSSSTTDPPAGMAIGFLMLVTLLLLGLAGLLAYAVVRKRTRLVWVVFGVCALPALSLVARGIYLLIHWFDRAP